MVDVDVDVNANACGSTKRDKETFMVDLESSSTKDKIDACCSYFLLCFETFRVLCHGSSQEPRCSVWVWVLVLVRR
jgi:hypothetical protein